MHAGVGIRAAAIAAFTTALIAVGCSSSDDNTPAAPNPDAGASAVDSGPTTPGTDSGAAPTTDSGSPSDSGAGGGTGTATATGSLQGKTLAMKDAYFLSDSFTSSGSTKMKVKVVDYTGACALYQGTNAEKQNSAKISLQIEVKTGTVVAGTYTVESDEAEIKTDVNDATCTSESVTASTGSIAITAISAAGVTGTFDFTAGADHVTGAFDAPACSGSGGTAFTCVP